MTHYWISKLPACVRKNLEGRHNLQKIIGNIGWLLADKVLRMVVGLFVGIWVARYLGPEQFGLLSYAGAYVALFSALATLGLDGIVVRELVREPELRDEILGTAFVLKLMGGVALIFLTVGSLMMIWHGDALVAWLVGIIAIGTLFQVFDVIDFWFQSQVAAKNTIWARTTSFIILSIIKVGLVLFHATLPMFALAGLAEIVLGAVGLVIVYRRSGQKLHRWRWSRLRAGKLLKDSWPMVLSGVSVAIYMKIDQVMLAQMLGAKAVGIYSAAIGLSEIWYFVPMAIVSSVFPSVVQARRDDELLYYRRIQKLFSLMVVLSLSIAVPITFISSRLILALYGADFSAAGQVLAIHIWASLFVFLGVAQGPWDLAESMTKITLFRLSSGAVLNIVLNIFMIPEYGIVGAAVATVMSQAVASVLLNVVVKKTRPVFYLQIKSLLFVRFLFAD
jgi:polysaccharide transporter, PST family